MLLTSTGSNNDYEVVTEFMFILHVVIVLHRLVGMLLLLLSVRVFLQSRIVSYKSLCSFVALIINLFAIFM